jgi:hypothetical protein
VRAVASLAAAVTGQLHAQEISMGNPLYVPSRNHSSHTLGCSRFQALADRLLLLCLLPQLLLLLLALLPW